MHRGSGRQRKTAHGLGSGYFCRPHSMRRCCRVVGFFDAVRHPVRIRRPFAALRPVFAMSLNLHPMLNVAVRAARAAGAIINRAALDVEALREHCRACLSGFKVPKRIFIVDALPQSSSGKVQKFRLSEQFIRELS